MLSAQAKTLNFVLKNFIKPIQTNVKCTPPTFRAARKAFDRLAMLMPKVPGFVKITPVRNGTVEGEWVETGTSADPNQVLLYLHGGGYFFGSPKTHRPITWRLSGKAGMKVLAIQYRMVPDYHITDIMNDAVAAYEWLLEKGYKPENIAIGGDSAGGGLTLITLLELKNRNLPQPRAAFCLSPFADLTGNSRTIRINAKGSILFHKNAMVRILKYFGKTHDVTSPLISPALGDFSGLPPLFFQVGSTELLLEDTIKAVKKAKEAGVAVTCNVWENMPHVFTLFSDFIPEGKRGIQEIADFIKHQGSHKN